MKGRFSLEQAKSIRAKRELAQELGAHLLLLPSTIQLMEGSGPAEDVRDFAERHTEDRPKRGSGAGKKQDNAGDDEGSDESEELAPRQRRVSH